MTVFPKGFTFESVNGVENITFHPVQVGIIQSTVGLQTTERQRKSEFALWLGWGILLLPLDIGVPDFGLSLELIPLASLVLGPSPWTELHHRLSGPPVCRWQIIELLGFHNCVSQFL